MPPKQKLGTPVVGVWAVFPYSNAPPRKFTNHKDAIEYWPSNHNGIKYVYKVWWDGLRGDLRRGGMYVYRRTLGS